MQITQLTIDHYRDLRDVCLSDLSANLNVIWGAAGAGKTNIVQFMREMVFGGHLKTREIVQPEQKSVGKMTTRGSWGQQTLQCVVERTETQRTTLMDEPRNSTQSWTRPGVEPAVFDHISCFNLHQRPSLATLVHCLQSNGLELSDWDNDAHLAELRSRQNELRRQLDNVDDSRESLSRQARQLEAEIDSLRDAEHQVTVEWSQRQDDLNGKILRCHQDLRAYREALGKVNDAIDALEGPDTAWSRSPWHHIEEDVDHLVRRRDELLGLISLTEGELRDAQQRLAQSGRQEEAAQRISYLQHRLHEVRTSLSHARSERELKMELSRVAREIHQVEGRYSQSILRQASHWMMRLGDGQVQRFAMQSGELCVEKDTGVRRAVRELSQCEQDHVYLSLSMAAIQAYRRQGTVLPLIIDDVVVRALQPRERSWTEHTAEALAEFSRIGHQVILTTGHQGIAELLQLHGARVYELNPVDSARWESRPQPAAEKPARWTLNDISGRLTNQVLVDVPRASASEQVQRPTETPVPGGSGWEIASQPGSLASSRYFLYESDDIIEVPSVENDAAAHLRVCGIHTVRDLLRADMVQCSRALSHTAISLDTLERWQAEARLACNVSDLRKFDAQILVACNIREPHALGQLSRSDLSNRVERLMQTESGRRLFQSGTRFERERITDWVQHVHDSGRSTHESMKRQDGSETTTPRQSNHRSGEDLVGSEKQSTVKLESHRPLRHYLSTSDPVVDAPSIGSRMAERLEAIGVVSVHDLLQRSSTDISHNIDSNRVKEHTVREWQQQTTLCCRIPEMRGHDAQILVACGITTTEELASQDPERLWEKVGPFVETKEGKRIIRNGKTPDLAEVTDWVSWAQHARQLEQAA